MSAILEKSIDCVYVGMKVSDFPDCKMNFFSEIDRLQQCEIFGKFGFHWSPFGEPVKTPDMRFNWYQRRARDCLTKNGTSQEFNSSACDGTPYQVTFSHKNDLFRSILGATKKSRRDLVCYQVF